MRRPIVNCPRLSGAPTQSIAPNHPTGPAFWAPRHCTALARKRGPKAPPHDDYRPLTGSENTSRRRVPGDRWFYWSTLDASTIRPGSWCAVLGLDAGVTG